MAAQFDHWVNWRVCQTVPALALLIAKHGAHALVVEGFTALVDMTGFEFGTDSPMAHAVLVEPPGQGERLRVFLGV